MSDFSPYQVIILEELFVNDNTVIEYPDGGTYFCKEPTHLMQSYPPLYRSWESLRSSTWRKIEDVMGCVGVERLKDGSFARLYKLKDPVVRNLLSFIARAELKERWRLIRVAKKLRAYAENESELQEILDARAELKERWGILI